MLAAAITDNTAEALVRIGATITLAVVATFMARWAVHRVLARIMGRDLRSGDSDGRQQVRAETVGSVLTALAGVAVWTFAVLLILGELGFDLAPLIAGAGIVGLAVAFGAQNLVSDFLSGLFMLAEDQYGVGDWVDVGDAQGTVEHVGLRTTRIRDLDGLLWTVRNGEVVRTANANKGWGRAVLDVGVPYEADARHVQSMIKKAADAMRADPEHADKFLDEPEVWGVQDLGDNAVSIRVVGRTRAGMQWNVSRNLRLWIKEALDREGIEIPFPQRTVWVRPANGTPGAAGSAGLAGPGRRG